MDFSAVLTFLLAFRFRLLGCSSILGLFLEVDSCLSSALGSGGRGGVDNGGVDEHGDELSEDTVGGIGGVGWFLVGCDVGGRGSPDLSIGRVGIVDGWGGAEDLEDGEGTVKLDVGGGEGLCCEGGSGGGGGKVGSTGIVWS